MNMKILGLVLIAMIAVSMPLNAYVGNGFEELKPEEEREYNRLENVAIDKNNALTIDELREKSLGDVWDSNYSATNSWFANTWGRVTRSVQKIWYTGKDNTFSGVRSAWDKGTFWDNNRIEIEANTKYDASGIQEQLVADHSVQNNEPAEIVIEKTKEETKSSNGVTRRTSNSGAINLAQNDTDETTPPRIDPITNNTTAIPVQQVTGPLGNFVGAVTSGIIAIFGPLGVQALSIFGLI